MCSQPYKELLQVHFHISTLKMFFQIIINLSLELLFRSLLSHIVNDACQFTLPSLSPKRVKAVHCHPVSAYLDYPDHLHNHAESIVTWPDEDALVRGHGPRPANAQLTLLFPTTTSGRCAQTIIPKQHSFLTTGRSLPTELLISIVYQLKKAPRWSRRRRIRSAESLGGYFNPLRSYKY